jgi:hypothetical protein
LKRMLFKLQQNIKTVSWCYQFHCCIWKVYRIYLLVCTLQLKWY